MSNGKMRIQASLLIIFLCAADIRPSAAQIIYPDQLEMLRTSTFSPYQNPGGRQAASSAFGSPRAINVASSQNFNPAPAQYSPPPSLQVPQYDPVQANRVPVTYTTPAGSYNNANAMAGARSMPLPANSSLQVYDTIYKGVTKFALDLNNAIYNSRLTLMATRPANVVFSPLNVASALALVFLGSSGYTFTEMSRILGLDNAQISVSEYSELYHQMFGFLLSTLTSTSTQPGYPHVSIGNGLFVQQGYPIRREYLSISTNVYSSEVTNLDFRSNGREAQRIVNNWVNMKTMGKIPTILSDPPNSATSVIIASALYFKGEWNQHFIRGATKRRPFTIEAGQSVDVDLMYNGGQFPFYEDPTLGVKIVGLPYKGLDYTMYVLLPKTPGAGALRAFESQLTTERLEYLINSMQTKTCIIALPRMKLSSSLSLKQTLQNLGLNTLFDRNMADLSVLSDRFPDAQTAAPTSAPPSVQMRPGKSDNNFVFPRFGEDVEEPPVSNKRNHFRYQDRHGGYVIEQWATGFYIRKLNRLRKDRCAHMESVRSGTDQKLNNRQKRQTQQSRQQDFMNYVNSLRFTPTGLDDLRNSGRLRNPGLFGDDVLHKVEIDIDEKGTEAAATTAVLLERDGNQKRLVANRPFLFVIRHDPTKLILFWGSINTPTPNYPTG